MKFSLIIPTISRTHQLLRLLKSLEQQTYRDFEVIIIDQNPEGFLDTVLEPFKNSFPIKYHRTSKKGAASARNIGLKYITGELIAFPDDDCWYSKNVLNDVLQWFRKNPPWDGMSGMTIDDSRDPVANRWSGKKGPIKKNTVFTQHIMVALFLKRSVIDSVGNFDETLGVGSNTPWGSGEETDYVLRALEKGFRLMYDQAIKIGHENPVAVYDDQAFKRGFSYGMGFGYLLRKHRFPLPMLLYYLMRPLLGMGIALLRIRPRQANYHALVFWGRLKGWLRWA